MNTITTAQQALDSLKNEVIGIYKHRSLGVFELVLNINKDAETITTVFISSFGAIQKGYGVQYQQGQLRIFPNGKNMNDMLNNPFEWSEFINQFE